MSRVVSWLLAIVVALIFIQSLFFKFTGAEDSIYIFQKVGESLNGLGLGDYSGYAEPEGRYAVGVLELLAAILILLPQTRRFGAIVALGILTGALYFHVFGELGIGVALPSIQTEGAAPVVDYTLIAMAGGAWLASLILVFVGNGVRD